MQFVHQRPKQGGLRAQQGNAQHIPDKNATSMIPKVINPYEEDVLT
jgi:hypothetical protein